MKILIISAAYPPMHAGEATNAYFLAARLAAMKCDVHILTSCGNVGIPQERITVHSIMRSWSWRELVRLRRLVKRCAPDAVLLMYLGKMYHYHPMITFVPALLKERFPELMVVTRFETVHAGADPKKTSLLSRVFRKVLMQWVGKSNIGYSSGTLMRDSDRVIALCEQHRDILVEEFPAVREKVRIIPPPPNMRLFSGDHTIARQRGRHKLGLSPDHFVIVFMGYIYPHKGLEVLLRGFERVSRSRSNARLVIIGGRNDLDIAVDSCYLGVIEKLAKELGVDDKITWTGAYKAEDDEASMYLYSADVCALPFVAGVQMNNSSLSSAAAHGIPILTTKGPRIETPFVHLENVLLCPPHDPSAIAEALELLMTKPELCESLGKGAARLAQEWFSWDRALGKTVEVLQGR